MTLAYPEPLGPGVCDTRRMQRLESYDSALSSKEGHAVSTSSPERSLLFDYTVQMLQLCVEIFWKEI
ncbi:unnamed protein product [Clavelina lepadiformis]|uniref:Uncharacterized protein n=1 Tax=Clavelina lepadiformis TaxID=159417 RepID=A0ABP0GCW7_CLALP